MMEVQRPLASAIDFLEFLVLLLFVTLFFGSCSSRHHSVQHINWKKELDILIPLNENQRAVPGANSIFRIGDSSFIALTDHQNRTISVFSGENGRFSFKTNRIPFPELDISGINVSIASKDTFIFVLLNAAKRPDYNHDSIFFLMDVKGEILANLDLSSLPVYSSSRERITQDSASFVKAPQPRLEVENGLALLSVIRLKRKTWDSAFVNLRIGPIGIYNLSNHFVELPNIPFLTKLMEVIGLLM